MRILEPIVRVVGQLSFRNKLRAAAIVSGVPLLIVAGVLVFALESGVAEPRRERAALAMQMPMLAVLANLHLSHAATVAAAEGGAGAGRLAALAQERRGAAGAAASRLVISDVSMPNMDGLTMVEKIRGELGNANVNVSMLTTESGPNMKERGKAAGIGGWIVKPFKGDAVLETLRKRAA